MANISTKELSALEDQLQFEKVLYCKYQTAHQETTEPELKACYQQYANMHKDNFQSLLTYLK